ncbi:hypothetical protein [Streptomyces sp. 11x1]|uniref:hypothetical protein n=1 Tax=Streptomyces sp. 11x1 TaxID=3038642 RepID=UPI00293109C5|nr:hypothetical protein [Streptomyces sp. 11x1]WNZ14968.1 hypothetical protein P8T65_46880 [Streptomyces sp. 11x1]
MDRSTALAVAQEAHKAAAAGKTVKDCPYDADADSPEQRFKARYWTLGFEQAQEDSAGR